MPGFDGTGPLGQGPMTGKGMGYCVLKLSEDDPVSLEEDVLEKEMITMPGGDGTGPGGMGPMTGRAAGYCAGYQIPGYMNPMAGRGMWNGPFVGAYGPAQAMMPYPYGGTYGYRAGFAPGWPRRGAFYGAGFGWARGRGFGRGRRRW